MFAALCPFSFAQQAVIVLRLAQEGIMLGYVIATKTSTANPTLTEAIRQLRAEGVVVAGACQINDDPQDGSPYHMDLHMIPSGRDPHQSEPWRVVVGVPFRPDRIGRGCRFG